MAEIHVLDKETIDKIAAGEVVERPSSVVKELLENAIDAKALAVTVEIKEGGSSLIRVTDNGCGIKKSEIKKAFMRHATSKIQSAEDLFHISSLGFRGEALSSISAVSMLELITKTKEELTGTRFVLEGGTERELEEIGAPSGTTILVRNLFFNTPVRKKFLKQPSTESGYINELMERIALSHPQISFKFINNSQVRFHTSGNESLKEVIYRIYGRELSTALIPVEEEMEGLRMTGFLGKPEINRSNRSYENYFVNGRYVKSSLIGKAIEEGYRKYLMQHKFPFAVLHFEIHSEDIDVNVHPTKMEVRFTNPERLYQFISSKISDCLLGKELIPGIHLGGDKASLPEQKRPPRILVPEPFETIRRNQITVMEEPPEYGKMKDILQKDPVSSEKLTVNRMDQTKNDENVSLFSQDEIEKNPEAVEIQIENPVQESLFETALLDPNSRMNYRILGQIFDTYWLICFQDKLFIVDQHAAHEKVKYESFMREAQDNKITSQQLFPPLVITLSGREESVLKEYETYFQKLGFEIESFGGKDYTVRSVPTELFGLGETELFLEMLDELSETPAKGGFDFISRKIAATACKAAVKGNMQLEYVEMEALIDQLLHLEDPYHCPHGRPTIISMSKYEIEKKFKRIV